MDQMEAYQCILYKMYESVSRGVSHECDVLTWIYVTSKAGTPKWIKWRHISASCIRCTRVYREEYPHECDVLTWIYVTSKAGHLNGSNGGISVYPV